MNIVTIYGIIKIFYNFKLDSIYFGIIMWLILMAINHFCLYKNRDKIFEKYNHYKPKRMKKGKIIFWLYLVSSLLLLLYLPHEGLNK
jgi:hypothetical protein